MFVFLVVLMSAATDAAVIIPMNAQEMTLARVTCLGLCININSMFAMILPVQLGCSFISRAVSNLANFFFSSLLMACKNNTAGQINPVTESKTIPLNSTTVLKPLQLRNE